MTNQKYYIGVEGGGSKTSVRIESDDSSKVTQCVTGPANYHVVGIQSAVLNIFEGIIVCMDQLEINGGDIEGVCMGLAGLNTKKDLNVLTGSINPKLDSYNLPQALLVNDAVISLRGATTNPNAILLIAGTGSNCYGVNENKQDAWVGGLESILSDDGSGYMMGLMALRAATQSMDGRIPHSLLEDLVLQKLDVESMREASVIVQSVEFNKTKIAEYALTVFEAVEKNDYKAIEILESCVNQSFSMINAAANRLGLQKTAFDLVLTGSVCRHQNYKTLLIQAVQKSFPLAEYKERLSDPLNGAILLAKKGCFT